MCARQEALRDAWLCLRQQFDKPSACQRVSAKESAQSYKQRVRRQELRRGKGGERMPMGDDGKGTMTARMPRGDEGDSG